MRPGDRVQCKAPGFYGDTGIITEVGHEDALVGGVGVRLDKRKKTVLRFWRHEVERINHER